MRYLAGMILLASGVLGVASGAATGPEAVINAAGGTVTRDRAGQIVGIDLHAGWVTDSDMGELAALPSLTRLDLSMTRITDRGLLDLKTASNLTDLNLYYCELLSDQGIAVGRSLPRLKRINLRGPK